jgi:hypothetical protein
LSLDKQSGFRTVYVGWTCKGGDSKRDRKEARQNRTVGDISRS